ncbi:MAG: hypothetical protein IJ562_02635 [Prevotella sp.]|nr:hypothetical protein [Prevotella sp.]
MGLRQKPIEEYRPTEEPKAVPTANAGENAGLEDVLQVAEADNAIQEKLGLLRKEIQEMELSRTALNEATKAQNSAKDDLGETMKAFYAAKDSANNIVTGIVAQIVRVENTRFTAHLDEGSVTQVQETNRKAIEQEREVLAQHRKELKTMFRKESAQLADIVRRGEGVWMSLRVFYIIAPIALFSIFAWVIYFSFWVYFYWIA